MDVDSKYLPCFYLCKVTLDANAFYQLTEALLSPDAISPMGERRYYYRGTADTATTRSRYCQHPRQTFLHPKGSSPTADSKRRNEQ